MVKGNFSTLNFFRKIWNDPFEELPFKVAVALILDVSDCCWEDLVEHD
jgi:hypothetical protein